MCTFAVQRIVNFLRDLAANGLVVVTRDRQLLRRDVLGAPRVVVAVALVALDGGACGRGTKKDKFGCNIFPNGFFGYVYLNMYIEYSKIFVVR